MRANLTKNLKVIKLREPVGIVYEHCPAFGEINEFAHLLLEALNVVGNGFVGHHLAHIGSAGRVADHCGAAANQGNRLITCHLQTLHQAERHEMSDMQAVRSRVKSDVEGCFTFVNQLAYKLLVRNLRNQAAGFQFFINCHCGIPPDKLYI